MAVVRPAAAPKEALLWAAWSAEAIWLFHGRSGEAAPPTLLPRRMKADLRYFLRLYRLADGTRLLRSADAGRTLLERIEASGAVQPLAAWPDELAALPPYRVLPLMDGSVAGISPDQRRLILWQPGYAPRLCALPAGFSVHDVTRDQQQRLWICGNLPSTKLRSLEQRRAFASSSDEGRSWQIGPPVHGGLGLAWYSLLTEAETSYRSIAAIGAHLVLSAETTDDDPRSTLLFVRDASQRWKSGWLKDDILRAVLPGGQGQLRVLSHYGQLLTIGPGRAWQKQSLLPALRQICAGLNLPPDTRYEIISAQATVDSPLLLVVSLRSSTGGPLLRQGEALVTVAADASLLVAYQPAAEPEIITASW